MRKTLLLTALVGSLVFAEGSSELILKVRRGYDPQRVAQKASELTGGQVIKILDSYVLIRAREGSIEVLKRLPELEWVEPNKESSPIEPVKEEKSFFRKGLEALRNVLFGRMPNDPFFPMQWGLAKIDAPRAWFAGTGKEEVVVAVIDSGIDYTHEDLKDNVWINTREVCGNGRDDDDNGYVDDCFGVDTFNEDGDPMDDFWHGTLVASVIGAVGNNGKGIAGVNWKVRILACKMIGERHGTLHGTLMDFFECARYIKAIKDRGENVVAVNVSLGWVNMQAPEILGDAINLLRSAGILMVASAGNLSRDNDQSPVYPCNFSVEFDNVVCVANSTQSDALHVSSNYGVMSVQVAAPGTGISVALPQNRYSEATGTSLSAPFVTGLAALIKAVNPNATYLEVKNRILSTVDKIPALEGKVTTGGRINAYKALGEPQPPQGGGSGGGGGGCSMGKEGSSLLGVLLFPIAVLARRLRKT